MMYTTRMCEEVKESSVGVDVSCKKKKKKKRTASVVGNTLWFK